MKSNLLCAVVALSIGLSVFSNPPAYAQGDACLKQPRCRRHIDQAKLLSHIGLSLQAIDEYRAAYAQKPVPWILYNIARIYERLNRTTEAESYYNKYVLHAANSDAAQHQAARQYLERLAQWRKDHPHQPFVHPAEGPGTDAPSSGQAAAALLSGFRPATSGDPALALPAPVPPPAPLRRPGYAARPGLWLGLATLGTTLLAGIAASVAVEQSAKVSRHSPLVLPNGWIMAYPFR